MLGRYCLSHGRLQAEADAAPDGLDTVVIYHLTASGALQAVSTAPELQAGEGLLRCAGTFYVDPLEIEIEFLKADSARHWLEALMLRHTERVRQIAPTLWVLAEMEEAST